MASPRPQPVFTVDEYLALERAAEERHEFLDGRIYAMAGESGEHGDISVNLVVTLGNQLKGTPCRARVKDTKVRSGPVPQPRQSAGGMFSYPDVVVICGEPEYHDAYTDVILNPAVIAEVLSPATEAFDRGEKFARYQTWNPTLQDYLLVSQDRPQIEHYTRQADGSWSYQRYAGLETNVTIASIHCILRLADVYDRVAFPDEGAHHGPAGETPGSDESQRRSGPGPAAGRPG
jgi:Uma2 family endonuclease